MAHATHLRVATLILLALHGATGVSQKSVSGVEKVISLLKDMSTKVKQERKAEQVDFAKFETWCTQETANLEKDIKKNAAEIELLDADIGKLGSDIASLGKAIAALDESVASHDANKKQETAQRERDHKEFLAESQDYAESVDALGRAIQVLQQEDYDRTGKAALLQLAKGSQIPDKAKSLIAAFVAMKGGQGKDEGDFASYDAPEANAYEFQSGNIVEMLKNLKDNFKSKLAACQKEEMNSKHAYDMIVTDLVDAIENKQKESKEKSMEKEHKAEKKALSEKQLASTSDVKAENERTLSAAQTECHEKTLSFKEKQQLRAEEIQAIEKAAEILRSPDVSGNAAKHLDLAQRRTAAAVLAQLASRQGEPRGHHQVLEFLASESQRLHSQRIALLAQKLAADPFGKVKQMISGMITRLMEEANQDAQHEGFCDTEMGKSKITRTRLSEEIDGLNAAIEDGKATIMKLTSSTTALTAEVEELVKSMGEATQLRKDEKAKNAETVKDAQAAQKAVAAATAVLKDFYEKASTATAFLQGPSGRKWGLKMGVKMGSEEWKALGDPNMEGSVDTGHKEGMQTFGEKEEGQQDKNEYGVLALLDVIQGDFANVEADTTAAEAAAQKAYENLMTESKRSQAVKEKKIAMNGSDKAEAESKLREDIADLKATQDKLLAADRYHEKLVPQCIDQGMTFEERTAAREAEIVSLKEALKILSNEDIATSSL